MKCKLPMCKRTAVFEGYACEHHMCQACEGLGKIYYNGRSFSVKCDKCDGTGLRVKKYPGGWSR